MYKKDQKDEVVHKEDERDDEENEEDEEGRVEALGRRERGTRTKHKLIGRAVQPGGEG